MHFDTMNQLQVETIVRRELNPVEMLHNHVTKRKILDEAGWDMIIKATGGIADAMGQWKHPGRCTMIPSNRITMQNVPHKVLGIDDTGHMQIMHPEQQYEYPGSKVFEIPLTAQQKTFAIQLMNRMKNGKPF
jgi:hypothetical protein